MKILLKRLTQFPFLSLISPVLFMGLFFALVNGAFAATEFISVVDTEWPGDYSSLSSWGQYNQCDLTNILKNDRAPF